MYRGVELSLSFTPDVGTPEGLHKYTTVFECYAEPICNEQRTSNPFVYYNPCIIEQRKDGYFKIRTNPTNIPSDKIVWSVVDSQAVFLGGSLGPDVRVRSTGRAGDCLNLKVTVLGASDERMHLKAYVVQ